MKLVICYVLIACFFFGVILSDERIKGKKLVTAALIAAAVWPLTISIGIGFSLGEKVDDYKEKHETQNVR